MGMKLDGIGGSQAVDSSGEVLMIEGADITSLLEGNGYMNYDHSKNGEDAFVGKIIYAKKIFKLEDCETDRQKMFWQKVNCPYIYIIGELFDDSGHPAATALAAIIRWCAKNGEKISVKFSVEGSTLERDDNILKKTVIRGLACTLKPCNHTAISDLLHDPETEKYLKKTETAGSYEMDANSFEELNKDEYIFGFDDLEKTLTAGNSNAAPGSLVGGSALAMEELESKKNRIKAALRDWDRTQSIESVIKAALPEVSDQYIQHFVDTAKQIQLAKTEKIQSINSIIKTIGSSPKIWSSVAQKGSNIFSLFKKNEKVTAEDLVEKIKKIREG